MKKFFYLTALVTLVAGLVYVFLVFEDPDCGDVEPCEPTRWGAFAGVITLSLILAYIGRAVGNRRAGM